MRSKIAIGAAVVIFLINSPLVFSTEIIKTVDFTAGQFAFREFLEQDGNTYVLIETSGDGDFCVTQSPGCPELPSATLNYIIPYGTQVASVSAQIINEEPLIQLGHPLHPVQEPWMTDASVPRPPFREANHIYQQNQFFPPASQLAECIFAGGSHRGVCIASIEVSPLRYNPVTNMVNLITSMQLVLELVDADPPIVPERASSFAISDMLNRLPHMVDNPEDIQSYLPPMPAIYENYENVGFPLPNGVPAECVVITSPELSGAFVSYAKWLTRRGIPTEIVKTSQIYAQYSGRDDAEKIRNFIIHRYQRDGLSYVLLGGNHRVVPKRLCYQGNTNIMPAEINMQICDLYYADVTRTWDADNDNIFGEPGHDNPDIVWDVAVGRVPATSAAEVGNWVTKRLRFELNPGGGNYQYLNRAAVQSADEMRDRGQFRAIYNVLPYYISCDTVTLVEQPSGGDPNPTGPTLETFIQTISNGLQFLEAQAHGSPDFYNIRTSGYNNLPAECYSIRDIHDVCANGQEYITFCLACWVGAMDAPEIGAGRYPCMAQADLVNPNGATAATYNTRWGWVATSYLLDKTTIELLFEMPDHIIANAHNAMKIYRSSSRDLIYGNTYFGCPTMSAWGATPASMQIDFPETLHVDNTPRIVTIAVRNEQLPLSGAMVTLWKGSEVYARGVTNSMGRVNFQINPRTPGRMLLTAVKTDYLPARAEIMVAPSVIPYVENLDHLDRSAEIRQPLIWNPLHHPSGDSLRAALTAAGYAPVITDSLESFLNSLENYTLFVIGGIYEYFEPYITRTLFDRYLQRLHSFLDAGGSIYWEGAVSLYLQDSTWYNRFQFDISICYQYPSTFIRGDDTLFLSMIDSLGLDESGLSEGCRAIGSPLPLNGMEVLQAPEAWPIVCNSKAVAYTDGNYRTFVASFPFCRLHDRYRNTRAQLADAIMAWLNSSSAVVDKEPLPRIYLGQNYPNPFNSSTEMEFAVERPGPVRLEVYDILGRKAATLVDRVMVPGVYRQEWRADDFPSGIYMAVLRAGGDCRVRKMVLMK